MSSAKRVQSPSVIIYHVYGGYKEIHHLNLLFLYAIQMFRCNMAKVQAISFFSFYLITHSSHPPIMNRFGTLTDWIFPTSSFIDTATIIFCPPICSLGPPTSKLAF